MILPQCFQLVKDPVTEVEVFKFRPFWTYKRRVIKPQDGLGTEIMHLKAVIPDPCAMRSNV